MNVQKIINQLKKKYPGKKIIKNNSRNPTEIICEIEPSINHSNYSLAIAVIDKSYPHFHKKTKEVYKVIKGKLTLFIEDKKFKLKENEKIEIPPKKIHSATGKETWVECFSTPGWKLEDHAIIDLTIIKLKSLIKKIVKKASELKNKYTDEKSAPVNYACVFSQSQEEFKQLIFITKKIGKIIKETPTGPLFLIKPLKASAGILKLLKIRFPDKTRPERGDADFTVKNFSEFKNKYLSQKNFKLIKRPEMEMIELMDKNFDVRAYFSNPPLDKQLKI